MNIQLSDHFSYKKLLRFVIPSIIMMIFTSIYGVVDGLCVSNFVGKTSFAAVNLIMPLLMILGAIGFMIGTGGCAIVSKTLGEGKKETANKYFSMLVYVTIIVGIILTIIGQIFIKYIASSLGASDNMLENCVLYGRITLISLTAFMLQNVFQSFLVAAEKPKIGLNVTIAAGLTNVILDLLFVAAFKWGIAGAAAATALSQLVGGIIPLIYFSRKNSSLLQLTKSKPDMKILLKTCVNGSSELMTNVSLSLVNMLYNFQLMRFAGENGIAAYGVIMYVNFIFIAIYIGYSIGSAPIIGYHYGAGNHAELKNLFKMSLKIIGIAGILLTLLSEVLAPPLTKIFVGYDLSLYLFTCNGFRIFAFSFLISGFNIFGSSFFTALSNGAVSALISFLRTLLFQVAAVLILPIIFGINGIWFAVVASEILAVLITFSFFVKLTNKYHYL
ncbi:MAG: MATE family efflux transporter [Ruminococcus sp.]|nr:MATE family efflux transporter [Ruminococcus sp.]